MRYDKSEFGVIFIVLLELLTLSFGVLSKFANLTFPDRNNYFYVFIFYFMRWARHVAYTGEGRNAYWGFAGKAEG